MTHLPLRTTITIVSLFIGSASGASEIYQWVDADGVVHFSDTRPEDDTAVKSLQVNTTNPADYDPTEDPYSILNQAARMNDSWAKLEKIREERQEKRREEAQRRRQYMREYYPYYYYSRPGYYSSVYPHRFRPPQFRVTRQQAYALEQTGLSGPRPASINSGAHHARVQRSRALPLVGPPPRPAPRPK